MLVWLVIPASGRFPVSDLCFRQIAWLRDQLAGRGITCHPVVVADDLNLDIAEANGLATIEYTGPLGDRVNEGFISAAEANADWVCFTGSDNWLHPDLFVLMGDKVITGDWITMVDLETGEGTVVGQGLREGLPPWFIPMRALQRCGFLPIPSGEAKGIEGHLIRALECGFREAVGHPAARVDFKTAENLSPYRALRHLGEQVDPWPLLGEVYPAALVAEARELVKAQVAA